MLRRPPCFLDCESVHWRFPERKSVPLTSDPRDSVLPGPSHHLSAWMWIEGQAAYL